MKEITISPDETQRVRIQHTAPADEFLMSNTQAQLLIKDQMWEQMMIELKKAYPIQMRYENLFDQFVFSLEITMPQPKVIEKAERR